MMKEILLTQGQTALVDDEDFEELNQFKWRVGWTPTIKSFYAIRDEKRGNKYTTLRMHRQIMQFPLGLYVDHINHNTLDNRKENLRIVTARQNGQNRSGKTTSKYPGVSWNKKSNKWIVWIRFNNKSLYLGMFTDEIDAFNAYKNFLKSIGEPEIIMPYKKPKNS